MNILHQETVKDLTIKIVLDEDPQSPREWDNLGTMVCQHNRYNLGDTKELITGNDRKNAIMLPLYLYDHSGITMSTSPFSCPWDSGQVGYIYALPEEVRKEYNCKRITPTIRAKVLAQLEQEVKTYDQFLTGQCYGYIIERDGLEIESCFGFYQNEDSGHPDSYILKEAREVANAVEPVEACYV